MGNVTNLETVKDWMLASNNTVILTGAGMSTESGVPDFRSASGWWTKTDPQQVATVEALNSNYSLFHEFYSLRIRLLEKCSPHKGHDILAEWEKRGLIHSVATQNVDGFHIQAGNKEVDELHGSIHTIRCQSCGDSASKEQFLNKESCDCGGKLRPNIVLFGETLPEDTWMKALANMKAADLVIVIGTSLEVYPVNQLPFMTNGKTVYINKDVQNYSAFDCVIQGSAKEILSNLNDLLLK